MANQQPNYALKAPPSLADDRRFLLLDANSTSREKRAAALRDRGANVDSVASAKDAQTLWTPGSHQVVLIDFRNAGEEMHGFYRDACDRFTKQKFGVYVNGPPYLAKSYRQYEAAGARDCLLANVVGPPAETDGNCGNRQPGLREAAKRIAAVRRLTRPGTCGNSQLRGVPVSDAMRIANRVLGG